MPPLVVDPDAIRRCGSDLLVASAQIDDLGTFAAGGARLGDWSGEAATAYHDGLRPAGRKADAMSLALRGVAQRVDAHADEMASLEDRRIGLTDWRLHIVRHLADLRTRIAEATEDQAAALQLEADGLRGEVASFGTDLDAWTTDIGAEEQAMNLAFSPRAHPRPGRGGVRRRGRPGRRGARHQAARRRPAGRRPRLVARADRRRSGWRSSPPRRRRSATSTASRRATATPPTGSRSRATWPSSRRTTARGT